MITYIHNSSIDNLINGDDTSNIIILQDYRKTEEESHVNFERLSIGERGVNGTIFVDDYTNKFESFLCRFTQERTLEHMWECTRKEFLEYIGFWGTKFESLYTRNLVLIKEEGPFYEQRHIE